MRALRYFDEMVLADCVVADLPKRYPTLYTALPDGIYNRVTDERIEAVSTQRGVEALISCSRSVRRFSRLEDYRS